MRRWPAIRARCGRRLPRPADSTDHASGAGVVGFHVVNLLIHAVNVLLVCALARRVAAALNTESRRVADPERQFIALCTAARFALHPVQTEAATYVLLYCALFSLGE